MNGYRNNVTIILCLLQKFFFMCVSVPQLIHEEIVLYFYENIMQRHLPENLNKLNY